VLKELRQLHVAQALFPIKKDDMTYNKCRRAFKYLMFLKEKQDRTVKAWGCMYG